MDGLGTLSSIVHRFLDSIDRAEDEQVKLALIETMKFFGLDKISPNLTVNNNYMGDHNENLGNAFSIGSSNKIKVEDSTIIQKVASEISDSDYDELADQLKQLLGAMRQKAEQPEEFQSMADISNAHQAAVEKDENKLKKYLISAGKFAYKTVEELSVKLLAEVIHKYTTGQ